MIERTIAVLALALLPGAAGAEGRPPVSGSLSLGGSPFMVGDAVAFPREDYEGKKVVVLLTEAPIAKAALASTLDTEGVIEALKEAGSTVEIEYREDGTWSKLQYALKYDSGSNSGSRYDAALAPGMKVTIKDGRVSGKLGADFGNGDALELTLAVPLVAPVTGSPLPLDGGPPGEALKACAAAYEAKKLADVRRFCSAHFADVVDSALRMRADGSDWADPWTPEGAGHCQVATLTDLQLTEGVVQGDEARFTARGGWVQEGDPTTCAGRVFLEKHASGWRVAASRLDTVSQ